MVVINAGQQQLLFFIVLGMLCALAYGTHKCVWVRGALQCHRDPSKQLNVEVRLYDRDGLNIFKVFDPDDLMGVTFTELDGTFQLDGCGDDFNWLPGLPNLPDPYIRIHHYCNSEHGETIELPEFYTFVPETYDLGIVVLDAGKQSNASVVAFPVPSNPRRQTHRQQLEKSAVGADKSSNKRRPASVATAVDSVEGSKEMTIFDVLSSREMREKFFEKNKKDNKRKEEGEGELVTTLPDDQDDGDERHQTASPDWQLPIGLANSQEAADNHQGAAKSKERHPNSTKQ